VHIHEKNDFAERFKISLDTEQKSNFVELSKQLCSTFKLVARISKFFAALLINFKIPTKLF